MRSHEEWRDSYIAIFWDVLFLPPIPAIVFPVETPCWFQSVLFFLPSSAIWSYSSALYWMAILWLLMWSWVLSIHFTLAVPVTSDRSVKWVAPVSVFFSSCFTKVSAGGQSLQHYQLQAHWLQRTGLRRCMTGNPFLGWDPSRGKLENYINIWWGHSRKNSMPTLKIVCFWYDLIKSTLICTRDKIETKWNR